MPQWSDPLCTNKSGRIFQLDKSFLKDGEIVVKRADRHSEGKIWKPGKSCVSRKPFADNDYVKINLEVKISQQIN